MKQFLSKLLPEGIGTKIIAIIGYLVVVFGLYCAVMYVLVELIPTMACGNGEVASTSAEGLSFSFIIATIQLLLSIGLIWMIRKLYKNPSTRYKIGLLIVTIILAHVELISLIGFGFVLGTSCS